MELKDTVAILTLNNPPVNQLSEPFRQELVGAVMAALNNQEIKAIVLTGTGKNFIAGADITEVKGSGDRDSLLLKVEASERFLKAIEDGPKPVIAAINGSCLGNGLEFALACHYRIAATGAELGAPEVTIGLIPGAGGTLRLPRLVGLQEALEMITTGSVITAGQGFSKSCLDEVVVPEHLLEQAVLVAHRFISGELDHRNRRTRMRVDQMPGPEEKEALLASAKGLAATRYRRQIAPLKAIEAIERGLSEEFDTWLKNEAQLFCDCAFSDTAGNLMTVFLNSRAAGRLPRIEGVKPQRIQTVGVLGGGVMASGIIALLLHRNFKVLLWDIHSDALEKTVLKIRNRLEHAVGKGVKVSKAPDTLMHDHFIGTTSLGGLNGVDLVIETAVEDREIKRNLWRSIEEVCRSEVILGTNAGGLPISEMAFVLEEPGRMIGLHFFNPADQIKLLEIARGEKTSDQTLATIVAFARNVGNIPVVVKDGPGLYVSRQLLTFTNESCILVGEGISPYQIDEAMTDFGMKMGPGTSDDVTGIDIVYRLSRTLEESLGEHWKVPIVLQKIYETGFYGQDTGKGWYDYSGKEPIPNQEMEGVIKAHLAGEGIAPKKVAFEPIRDRLLARAINEATYMIGEGVCERPQDMDLAVIYGGGFPADRGGILRYADAWGVANVYRYLLKMESEHGIRFRPSALLSEMAMSGGRFYRD
jgi:3-hydroxyacyl-CoA dehydrogenase/enoyl-CoA hydratase/carnithine racemase